MTVEKGQVLRIEVDSPQNTKWLRYSIICMGVTIVIAAIISFFVIFFALGRDDDVDIGVIDDWFITRDMWLAPPFTTTERTTEFEPLRLVVIGHTVSPICETFANCAAELRQLQSYFQRAYNQDIPYNFMIGNEGRVYEGRGWGFVGGHVLDHDSCTVSVAFIGDYRVGLPSYSEVTPLQLERAQLLLEEGVKLGFIHSDYEVLGTRDLRGTYSPGENIYNVIQQWPNFAHNHTYRQQTCEEIYAQFDN